MVLAGPGYQHAQSDTLCPFRPSSLTIVEHTGPTRLPLLSGKSIELKTLLDVLCQCKFRQSNIFARLIQWIVLENLSRRYK